MLTLSKPEKIKNYIKELANPKIIVSYLLERDEEVEFKEKKEIFLEVLRSCTFTFDVLKDLHERLLLGRYQDDAIEKNSRELASYVRKAFIYSLAYHEQIEANQIWLSENIVYWQSIQHKYLPDVFPDAVSEILSQEQKLPARFLIFLLNNKSRLCKPETQTKLNYHLANFFSNADYETIKRNVQSIEDIAPYYPNLYCRLVEIYVKNGDKENIKRCYQSALTSSGGYEPAAQMYKEFYLATASHTPGGKFKTTLFREDQNHKLLDWAFEEGLKIFASANNKGAQSLKGLNALLTSYIKDENKDYILKAKLYFQVLQLLANDENDSEKSLLKFLNENKDDKDFIDLVKHCKRLTLGKSETFANLSQILLGFLNSTTIKNSFFLSFKSKQELPLASIWQDQENNIKSESKINNETNFFDFLNDTEYKIKGSALVGSKFIMHFSRDNIMSYGNQSLYNLMMDYIYILKKIPKNLSDKNQIKILELGNLIGYDLILKIIDNIEKINMARFISLAKEVCLKRKENSAKLNEINDKLDKKTNEIKELEDENTKKQNIIEKIDNNIKDIRYNYFNKKISTGKSIEKWMSCGENNDYKCRCKNYCYYDNKKGEKGYYYKEEETTPDYKKSETGKILISQNEVEKNTTENLISKNKMTIVSLTNELKDIKQTRDKIIKDLESESETNKKTSLKRIDEVKLDKFERKQENQVEFFSFAQERPPSYSNVDGFPNVPSDPPPPYQP